MEILFHEIMQLLSKQTSMKVSIELKIHSHLEELCKKVLSKITQNSQENICVRVSFLIKLSAKGLTKS